MSNGKRFYASRKAFDKLVKASLPEGMNGDNPAFFDRVAKTLCGLTVKQLQAKFPGADRGLFATSPTLSRVTIAACAVRWGMAYNPVRASNAGCYPVEELTHQQFCKDMAKYDRLGWSNRHSTAADAPKRASRRGTARA